MSWRVEQKDPGRWSIANDQSIIGSIVFGYDKRWHIEIRWAGIEIERSFRRRAEAMVFVSGVELGLAAASEYILAISRDRTMRRAAYRTVKRV